MTSNVNPLSSALPHFHPIPHILSLPPSFETTDNNQLPQRLVISRRLQASLFGKLRFLGIYKSNLLLTNFPMTTLITGGGSATGVALAKLLTAAGHDVLFASRSGQRIPEGYSHVKLDWADPTTFEAPFAAGRDIQYVYLLLAGVWDPLPQVKSFIDLAYDKGVKRIVLTSASGKETEKGPDAVGLGQVHTYLDQKGVDYVALRPTWFAENLLRGNAHEIKANSELKSIHPKGRVPFIAVQDIAEAAFDAITNVDSLPCREPILIGPELVTYDEVAAAFSKTLGRPITHTIISSEEQVKRYMYIVPEQYARVLIKIEEKIEDGVEELHLTDKRTRTGKIGILEWIESHKAAFA